MKHTKTLDLYLSGIVKIIEQSDFTEKVSLINEIREAIH